MGAWSQFQSVVTQTASKIVDFSTLVAFSKRRAWANVIALRCVNVNSISQGWLPRGQLAIDQRVLPRGHLS